MTTLTEQVQALMRNQQFVNLFSTLAERWADEHEYEDIKEYAIPLRKLGLTIVAMTKRPFGAIVQLDDTSVHFVAKLSRRRLTIEARLPH